MTRATVHVMMRDTMYVKRIVRSTEMRRQQRRKYNEEAEKCRRWR